VLKARIRELEKTELLVVQVGAVELA